ncbi:Beta-lactamase HcpA precursor [Variovorax sp. SRS16]|uniref:tetratricopeptide repeat protein n=1 Tax=Variovorax sp. SRS16 TaxID=282217 RepID=UPI001318207D|nr:tetratricopeptide repeat protein [Variovorax sp. SRS16]VTU25619.1 Beta-lactamase HcpA precursor [Variovorax sp. SRS16]
MTNRLRHHLLGLALVQAALVLPLDLAAQTRPAKGAATAGGPGAATAAERAVLRVACEGDNVGAAITLNGRFKGECPVDITVLEGRIQLRAVKQVDDSRERTFEQGFSVVGGTGKRIDVVLGPVQLTADAQQRESQRAKEAQQRKADALAAAIKAAEGGDASAMYSLGRRFELGHGLPIDYAQAAAWYGKAADAGDGRAASQLGYMYLAGSGVRSDKPTAMKFIKKAADLNDPRGLGLWALNGYPMRGNDFAPEAISLYQRGAEGGDPQSQHFMYVIGSAAGQSAKSQEWARMSREGYRRQAEDGDFIAMFGFADSYRYFEYDNARYMEFTRDAIGAAEKAAAAGNSWAALKVALAHYDLFHADSGGNKDAEKAAAREWLKKAADLGEPQGKWGLANMTFD